MARKLVMITSDRTGREGEIFIQDVKTKEFLGKVYNVKGAKKIAQAFIDGVTASEAETEAYKAELGYYRGNR